MTIDWSLAPAARLVGSHPFSGDSHWNFLYSKHRSSLRYAGTATADRNRDPSTFSIVAEKCFYWEKILFKKMKKRKENQTASHSFKAWKHSWSYIRWGSQGRCTRPIAKWFLWLWHLLKQNQPTHSADRWWTTAVSLAESGSHKAKKIVES